MKKKNFSLASPDQVKDEKEIYRKWLLANGYDSRVASDYASRWSRVDQIADQIGYPQSILSMIVGLLLNGKPEDAAELTLIVRDNLKKYYRKNDPQTKAWNDVATSLNKYAQDYLLKGKNVNVARFPLVCGMAQQIVELFCYSHMRNIIRRRLTTQNRGGLPMKKINSKLSKFPDYQKWLNDLVNSVIFIGYVPIDDPYFLNPVYVPFKEISKLLIDQDSRVLFRRKNDVTVYTLLTPIAFCNSLRPAKAGNFSMLEIDHEPAISNRLKNLSGQIPNITNLTNDEKAILQELRLIHKDMKLRIMEARENHKKGANNINIPKI